jgi:hypothetical protein
MAHPAPELTVPLAPVSSKHVFVAQPVSAHHMGVPRAFAAALLWRFLGVNTGYGGTGDEGGPGGVTAGTPSLIAQLTLAEWLCVWAAAPADSVSMMTAGPAATAWGVPEVTSATGPEAPGPALWTPAAVLGFLGDWVGAVAPLHATLGPDHAAFRAAAAALVPGIKHVRPTGKTLRHAVATGAALPAPALASALDGVFGGPGAGTLRTRTLLLRPVGHGVPVPLVTPTGGHPRVAPALDVAAMAAGAVWREGDVAMVPAAAAVPDGDTLEALTDGAAVGVVAGGPEGFLCALLSSVCVLPPLLGTVLAASAATMVAAVHQQGPAPTARMLRALRAAASGLWFTHAAAAAAAVADVFLDKHPELREAGAGPDHHPGTATPSLIATAPPLLLHAPVGAVLPAPALYADPTPLHLYYGQKEFQDLAPALDPLVAFTTAFDVVPVVPEEDQEGGEVAPVLHVVPTGAERAVPAWPLAVLSPVGGVLTVVDPTPPATAIGPSVFAPALWSVLFGREDVLAVALSPEPGAAAAFVALAGMHVHGLAHCRRHAAGPTVRTLAAAIAAGQLFTSNLAAALVPGVVLEVVIPFSNLGAGQRALAALETAVSVCVAEVRKGHVVVGPARARTFTHALDMASGATTVLQAPLGPLTSAQVVAWSEPVLVGLVLTPATAAVAAGLGSSHVVAALRAALDAADPDAVNDDDVGDQSAADVARGAAMLDAVTGHTAT